MDGVPVVCSLASMLLTARPAALVSEHAHWMVGSPTGGCSSRGRRSGRTRLPGIRGDADRAGSPSRPDSRSGENAQWDYREAQRRTPADWCATGVYVPSPGVDAPQLSCVPPVVTRILTCGDGKVGSNDDCRMSVTTFGLSVPTGNMLSEPGTPGLATPGGPYGTARIHQF